MSVVASEAKAGALPGRTKKAAITYRFKITLEGLMLLVVIILVGFAAWHSGTNLLYLIFSILIAFYLLHGALLWQNLRALKVEEIFPETVIVEQPFDVVINVANRKKYMATYAVSVTHEAVESRAVKMGSAYFSVVPGAGLHENFYTAVLKRRGYHTVKRSAMSTRYPFGFEERTIVHPLDSRILALPRTYAVGKLAANIPFGFGDQESAIRGTGTELYGLREYVPGEHARHVHWKTSARVQKLMLAEYSRDERRQVVLLLNNSKSEQSAQTVADDFENAITLTASLARHFLTMGYEVGLITHDGEVPVEQGPTQLLSMLRHLAVLELVPHRALSSRHDRVLQVSFDDEPTAKSAWHVLDSRKWKPPTEKLQQGEKRT